MSEDTTTPEEATRRTVLRAAGASVALAAGAGGTAAAQEAERHTVEMTDELVFDPDSITVAPGDTVVWENVGSVGHSITAYEDEIPDGADYFASGGFDSEEAARGAYPEGDIGGGESYEHTFDATGEYGYLCIPHESVGMTGTVTVQEGGAPASGGGGEGGGRPLSLPGGAVGAAFMLFLLGSVGTAVAAVLAGELYAPVTRGEGHSSAYTAGLGVAALATILLIAVVARLLLL